MARAIGTDGHDLRRLEVLDDVGRVGHQDLLVAGARQKLGDRALAGGVGVQFRLVAGPGVRGPSARSYKVIDISCRRPSDWSEGKDRSPMALSPTEAADFTRHLRPLVESGAGLERRAHAYLTAAKD